MKLIPQLLGCGLFILLYSALNAQVVTIGGYNVYYGHIHNHCNFSDGTGTAAQAYAYARDNGKLDFFSLADHEYSLTTTEYSTMISTANSYNQDGTFVAFYGFEWSHSTYGHVAIIGSPDYCTSAATATNTFSEMVTWLSARDVVAFLNHPGRQNSTGVEFDHFTSTPTDKIVGIELWNKTELFTEFYYTDGYFANDGNKSWFDEALTRGWKMGAAGAEDNHSGTWGTITPARLAVLASAKTRTDIMNAMKARRFYSTLDKDLGLSFKINGSEMGSTITGGTYTLQILANDGTSDIFSQVQLLKNGAVLNTWTPNTTSVNISQSISCADGEYYYVRVKQSDGGEAVSSPIWIVGGTANVSPTINLTAPANNSTYEQPATITITANAADIDGTVTKVEFYQGTTRLGEDTTAPYSYTWSGVMAGTYSITGKATDNIGAVTVSTAVTVTVIDPAAPIMVSSVIATGSDDAEESVASGAVVLTSTDLELIYDVSTTAADQVVGMRFTNLNIPKAAGIANAYIQFTCDEVSTAAASLTIKGEAADNTATFTTATGNISARSKTTASVGWIPASWPTVNAVGVDQRTPELKSIIQEIVNRTGYTSSSAISIIITGTGARIAEAYEGVPASAAKLYVQYSLVQQVTPTFAQIGPLCQNSTPPSLPLVSTNGITGTWSPSVISTATAGSTVYTFTPAAGQNATTATITIAVNPLPSVTNSPLSQTITSGSNTTLVTLTSSVPGTTFTWTATATAGVTGFTLSGTSAIPVQTISTSGTSAGTVTYAIIPTANGCQGSVTNYVITVNPATVTYSLSTRISTGIDDVEQYANGTMLLNSDDIELVYDNSTSGNQTAGLRFRSIAIPQGAVITKAYIQFTADEVTTAAASLTIKGQDVDNPSVFTTSKKNVSNRTKTTASVSWIPTTWPKAGASGTAQQTPELKTIIQEIVSRTGWTSGNSMVFIITGTGKRTAESYEGMASGAALLYVEYTLATLKTAKVASSLMVSEQQAQGKLTCYPVPFTKVLNISFVPEENETLQYIEIFSISGNLVKKILAGNITLSVDLGELSPGIYLMEAQTDGNRYIKTIVKK